MNQKTQELFKGHVLVIDDDPIFCRMMSLYLTEEGYHVSTARDVTQGLRLLALKQPDVVLLDLLMPRVNGAEACRRIKAVSDVPVIVVSVRADPLTRIRLLELGADDVVSKSADLEELALRIALQCRRRQPSDVEEGYQDPYLKIDLSRQQVEVKGQLVELTPREWTILACLVRHMNQVVRKEVLVREVWDEGPSLKAFDRLRAHIAALRHKLEREPARPEYLHTSHGVGYVFRPRYW